MAEKLKEDVKTTVNEAPKYTVRELAKAHKKLFDTTEDIVTAALKRAGKNEYTVAEAKKLTDDLRKKVIL